MLCSTTQTMIQPINVRPVQANPYTGLPVSQPAEPRTFCEGRFNFMDKLGEGSYGKVYKVYDNQRKEVVALKKVKFQSERYQGVPQSSLRELAILKELNHVNIIKLEDIIGSRDSSHEIFLVFQMADHDLRRYQHNHKYVIPRHSVKTIMMSLLKGVDYLHQQRIIHRDLKPENVLIGRDGENVKIADFGLSRTIHMPLRPYSKEILSMWYRSPEICMGYKNYSIGVDIWALGCIFFELLSGYPLFKGKTDSEMLYKIFEIQGTPSGKNWDWVRKISGFNASFPQLPGKGLKSFFREVDPLALDLMDKLLKLDPTERISCADAINHHYFCAEGIVRAFM